MIEKKPSFHEMDKSEIPLSVLVEEYLTVCRLEGKTAKTIRGYREKLGRFLKTMGDATLADFTLINVREHIALLQTSGKFTGHPLIAVRDNPVSAMTVRNHVRALTAFASWLEREEYTKQNVLGKLRPPKTARKVMQTLTPEEISKILDGFNTSTANGCRNAAVVCLFLDSGLRSAELQDLRMPDLHLEDRWLKVMGKGQKERVVPFGNRTARLLQQYINRFRPKVGGVDVLFLNIYGEPLTENAVASLFKRIAKRSGIPRLHVHLLRHTFATNFLIGGGDSLTLQKILGHETLEMTRRYVDQVASQVTVLNERYSPIDRLIAQSRRNSNGRI